MNFKTEYLNELSALKHDSSLDMKILSLYDRGKRKYVSFKRILCAAACIVLISGTVMAVSGENIFSRFTLSVTNDVLEMEEMIPIEFDYSNFIDLKNARPVLNDPDNEYYCIFENAEDLYNATGIKLADNEKMSFKNILVSVSDETGIGHISAEQLISECKDLRANGQFIFDSSVSSEKSDLGYGFLNKEDIIKEFEFKNNKKAYVIKTDAIKSDDRTDRQIIFCLNNIQYQMFAHSEDVENGKIYELLGSVLNE